MRGRRVGRPGLVGTMARTAVIAGTASAVSGNVQRRQAAKYADRQELEAAREQQRAAEAAQAAAAYPPQAPAYPPQGYPAQAPAYPPQAPAGYAEPAYPAPPAAPAAPPSAADDLMAQLTKLGEMHSMGLLNDQEFAAAKARLLSS